MSDTCPCCGRELSASSELRWDMDAKALTFHGNVLRLSRVRSMIFDTVWRARGKHVVSLQQMMERVYADDPNGGPESPNIISVQVIHLKKLLAPFGLTIASKKGYSLMELPREQVAA